MRAPGWSVHTYRSGALRQKAVYLVVDADGADCWGNEPLYEAGTDRLIGFTTSGGYGHSTQLSLGALQCGRVRAWVHVLDVAGSRNLQRARA